MPQARSKACVWVPHCIILSVQNLSFVRFLPSALLFPNFFSNTCATSCSIHHPLSHLAWHRLSMHVSSRSRASWLVVCLGVAHAAASNATGIVEVDLVFPRNETYAPMPLLPVVFAFQNSELASLLNPKISFVIWDRNNMSDSVVSTIYDMRWANYSSSDPYFEYRAFTKFNTEGVWMLTWDVGLDSCTEDSFSTFGDNRLAANYTSGFVIFTTKGTAQEVDLVSATSNCSGDAGATINITSTLDVPARVDWDGGETCAVVASSTPAPDPCQAKIDSAAASSISSSMTSQVCRGTAPPVACPSDDEESAAERQTAGRGAYLTAAFGVLGYILG